MYYLLSHYSKFFQLKIATAVTLQYYQDKSENYQLKNKNPSAKASGNVWKLLEKILKHHTPFRNLFDFRGKYSPLAFH